MLVSYEFPDPVARKYPGYPNGWNLFSYWIKQWAHWTCSDCKWRPQKKIDKQDIIVHHIGGNPLRNVYTNLVVLCCDCHDLRHGRGVALHRKSIIKERRRWVKKYEERKKWTTDESGWPVKVGGIG